MAVPTAPYWDDDLEALRARLEANWPKVDAKVAEEAKKNPKMLSGARQHVIHIAQRGVVLRVEGKVLRVPA